MKCIKMHTKHNWFFKKNRKKMSNFLRKSIFIKRRKKKPPKNPPSSLRTFSKSCMMSQCTEYVTLSLLGVEQKGLAFQ